MKFLDNLKNEICPPLSPEEKKAEKLLRAIFSVQLRGSEEVIKLTDEYRHLVEILHPPFTNADGKEDIDAQIASIDNDCEVKACEVEFVKAEEMIRTSARSADHELAAATIRQLVEKMKAIVEQRKSK